MKKLMAAVCAVSLLSAFAEEKAEAEEPSSLTIWGFGNYGIYSGYQLYGSLVNREPTMQGYFEVNANLPADFGYLGVGLWSNSDLTKQRDRSYGRIFNEWDFNAHWGKTFYFDDDKTWGLDYRASVVWYYYPHHLYQRRYGQLFDRFGPYETLGTKTTFDFDHSFALVNPYVIPYINVVKEYHESKANLVQFGLKKTVSVDCVEGLTLTPILESVWRDDRYNWCFPTGFGATNDGTNGGIATLKLELDANYQITEHFGIFAKVAYCSIIDPDLRDNCDTPPGARNAFGQDLNGLGRRDYGECKDFAWGGVGVTFNF